MEGLLTGLVEKIISKLALAPEQITAGGAADGVEQDGIALDRINYSSVLASVPVSATLADGETAIVEVRLKTCATSDGTFKYVKADGTLTATIGDAVTATATLTGGTGGSTETAVLELRATLNGAEKYIKVSEEVTFSAASTDTAVLGAVAIMGARCEVPVDGVTVDAII